jgi:acetyl esterase/lipase
MNYRTLASLVLPAALHLYAPCAPAQPMKGPPGGDAIPHGGPSIRDAGLRPTTAGAPYAGMSATQTLDVYLPSHAGGPAPAVIYAHPGGFRFGDKSMAGAAVAKAMLAAGIALVTVDYRLSGEARFPAAVQDLFAAIGYVKAHAQALGVDPDRIVLFGESAGANLAALAGLAHDAPAFRRTLADPGADLRVRGVIALYPPVDFLKIDAMLAAQGCDAGPGRHDAADGMESRYLGAALVDVPDLVRQANPATYATRAAPRFLVENGDKDCAVGSGQAPILVDALERAGAAVEYRRLAGAGHGGPAFESAENVTRLVRFVQDATAPASK